MNIYFSGLNGVGIGPLVEIALDAGYQVQGSDLVGGLQTAELEERGVPMSIGAQDGQYLREIHAATPIDWFVYTSALPVGHSELVVAKELGIPTAKRDAFLNQLITENGLQLIAVAGTHGKTTTTGMLVWTLSKLDVPVSYAIGTTLPFGPNGRFVKGSKYFVYECDEFDRNFLHFRPYVSLLTSVDYDHPDTYPTQTDYTQAFTQFIEQSTHSIAWKTDIAGTAPASWLLEPSDVSSISLPGAHNRRNATLVLKTIEYLGLDVDAAKIALASFPGTDRRFEKLADNLYSDYGHHPTEIAATLQMARELSEHVVLVYQPHQNVRQHELRDSYTSQFEQAETVYWLPTYLSREDPELTILGMDELTHQLTNKSAVHSAQLDSALWYEIESARKNGKLVLCMSAGSLDGWLRDRLNAQ